ncbi:MAG TPA: ABC transporter ATP-binding protein [Solirubrobacterales bacterium]|nr:ABC transporter ATP-binding protein [Solirubrobacterales bacterium]
MSLYELSGVERRYEGGSSAVLALAGLDLEIAEGEFVAVVGASGSGKSTLLQLLGALDLPTAGTVRFEDRDLGSLSGSRLADLRRDEIGFVFQQFNLLPTLTALGNVEVAMAPTALEAAQRRERAAELLDRVGLGDRSGHLPTELSGGEQQRVAIARALANRPRVVLADEPTGNLDSRNGADVLELISNLHADTGVTVVLVTHEEAVAERAERRIQLADGELVPEPR